MDQSPLEMMTQLDHWKGHNENWKQEYQGIKCYASVRYET
jgi:hypothetical protein